MKYLVIGDWGNPALGVDCTHPTEGAAVRHARALEELVLAAVAEHRAELCKADGLASDTRPEDATARRKKAVAELIALEKVVIEKGKGEE